MPITGLLNKRQFAYTLGISVPTVRRMIADEQLSTLRVGGLDYPQAEVERLQLQATVTAGVFMAVEQIKREQPELYRALRNHARGPTR